MNNNKIEKQRNGMNNVSDRFENPVSERSKKNADKIFMLTSITLCIVIVIIAVVMFFSI